MKDLSRFFCDPLKIIKSIIALALGVLAVSYIWIQLTSGFSSGIETEPAVMVEVNRTVDAQAYIFRDETVITVPGKSVAVTLVSDSKRVYNGQRVANVYGDSEDAQLQDTITRVQRKIDVLEKSSIDAQYLAADISKFDNDIMDTLNDIYSMSSKGQMSGVVMSSEVFLVKLNKRSHVVNSDSDFTPEYTQLLSERDSLERQINAVSSPVFAGSSGYFYSQVDGYEDVFDFDSIENMSLSEFENIINSQQSQDAIDTSIGKIVSDFVWYVACNVSSSDLAGLEEGNYYKLLFPENSDVQIKMELCRIIRETSSKNAVCIFRSNSVPTDFSYKRSQKSGIIIDKCEGLAIPKQALRVVDGVKGVYILVGDVVHFRQVKIISEEEGYYVVSNDTKDYVFEDENTHTGIPAISLYDNVIVTGKNLFEGKIII